MSRIERALEKAAQMRAAVTASGGSHDLPARPAPRRTFEPAVFKPGEGSVDRAKVDRHIVGITDPYSFAAEEYRKLRARVLRSTKKDFHNTIMVTSAQSGEGKTITAINLAVALAQELDHTVLLIDTDLRKPSIHTYLGLEPKYGISDYLTSRRDLVDIMIKTGIGKLVFVPAGRPPENPAELINSERMRSLVREVKERYRDRYVIFDSVPLLAAADSLSLCNYVDGVIFVAAAGRTDQKTAVKALSLIKDHNILGSVFNNVKKHPEQGRYPYYFRSGAASGIKSGDGDDGGAHDTVPG